MAETEAVKAVFGEQARRLVFGCTKSMTGHLLGGAGALEFGVSLLAADLWRHPAHDQPVHTRPAVRSRLRAEPEGRAAGGCGPLQLVRVRRAQRHAGREEVGSLARHAQSFGVRCRLTPAPQRSAGIVVLATIAVAAALYLAREFLVPIGLAILFTALLRPVVRRLERVRVPAPAGAAIVLVLFVGLLVTGGLMLVDPVRDWMAQAPATLAAAQRKLETLRRPLQTITTTAQKVEAVTSGGQSGDTSATAPPAPSAGFSVSAIAARVFGTTASLLGGLVETVLLTLLLLASGGAFLGKLVNVLPLKREKQEAVKIVEEAESVVGRYLTVTALINAGQGTVVGLAMWLLHLPNPVLWGILTFFLEFIPYLGGASMLILLTLAGLATFDHLGQALLPPAVYLTITTLQNNLVSPVAYGRRLNLNPPAVFVGVLFWWFLWGVAGAFLAVPILATVRILGDHLDGLAPVAEFLSD